MSHSKPVKKTKVLYVSFEHIPGPTGTSCWITEELSALAKKLDVDAMSLKNEDLSHIERYYGARLLRVPMTQDHFLEQVRAFQRALSRQLDSEPYRVCHFTSIWEGMLLVNRKQRDGAKLIYEVHSLPSLDFRVTHPEDAQVVQTSMSLKQQEDRCLSLADVVLAGSEPIRQHLLSRGVGGAKIHLIPPSIDSKPYEACALNPGQAGTVLYLGSLFPWQGVEELLEAVASLPRQIRTRLMLICPRDEPWFSQVQKLVSSYGLKRSVDFIEPVEHEHLPDLLAKAHVCVAPSANHEHNRIAPGLPHKVLVYMAARRPVLAAYHPATKDLLRHGEQGLLHPPGDIGSMANNLRKLLLDRELATQLGNQAGLRLDQRLPLAASIEALLNLYEELVGGFGDQPDRLVSVATDTVPGLPLAEMEFEQASTDPAQSQTAGGSEDTKPIPKKLIEAEASREAGSESPLDAPAPDTELEADLVFSAVEERDQPPPSQAEAWQVQDASEVSLLPPASDKQAPMTNPTSADTSPRFLLGGPPFKVSREPAEKTKAPTQEVKTTDGLQPEEEDKELSQEDSSSPGV